MMQRKWISDSTYFITYFILAESLPTSQKNDMFCDNYGFNFSYIQFKKVTGGTRSECEIVNGIAFTKNVAHRSMVSRLESPRILLLNCSIVYQRVEGRFLSLEPVMMQVKLFF